jgi:hypothetical protein
MQHVRELKALYRHLAAVADKHSNVAFLKHRTSSRTRKNAPRPVCP